LDIGKQSRGFIYIVSGKGITGKTTIIIEQIQPVVTTLRKTASIPLLIGFGVSSPDIARELATIADGVIVGSAIVNFVTQNFNKPQFLGDFAQYLSQYRQALDQLSENE